MKIKIKLTSLPLCLILTVANLLAANTVAADVATAKEAQRLHLPAVQPSFSGVINRYAKDSTPTNYTRPQAPESAPNVVLFMSDDVGFAMSSTFGGPVPTPNLDRLANKGVSYNRVHTTGVCSPSRAALLTGRNHHNAGTGVISDMPSGYPGYNGRIPDSTATIADVLTLNGYNTAMFGKHHNIPPPEHTQAGPFDQWPTGLGFEYFYGFPSGETDQWHPVLYKGTDRIFPTMEKDETLDSHLVSNAIHWIHNQQLAAPDKPFFIYLSPGSAHAPHQAPAQYIDQFKGAFDSGWDDIRSKIYKRQLAMNVIPDSAKLTARPKEIPSWDSLSDLQKRYAAKTMEVAAGMLAYQDAQFGRLLDEIERIGAADNTLVIAIAGDNGASGEGGPGAGLFNSFSMPNGIMSNDQVLKDTIADLGTERGTSNYPAGWAWAMNTPFRWTKQYASFLGGIRNGMVMSWLNRDTHSTGQQVCSQFGHLVDIAPTVYQAAGIPAPITVKGVQQKEMDGESLLSSLDDCSPNRPRTQYFELQGKAGLFHNGWFLSSDNGRTPWMAAAPKGQQSLQSWQLFNLETDFSQAEDLSDKHPQIKEKLIKLWHKQAKENNVYPINSDRMESLLNAMQGPKREVYDFWGNNTSISAHPQGLGNPATFSGAFTIAADITLQDSASGVILALGGHSAGWSFYLENGYPVFSYARSSLPGHTFTARSTTKLAAGDHTLKVNFISKGVYQPAQIEIIMQEEVIASAAVERTWMMPLEIGEHLDAGRDTGVPVVDYMTKNGKLQGTIKHARLKLSQQ